MKNNDNHPAADLFPPMDGISFISLVKDIQKHGQQEPIYTYKGKILDGRNRLKACKELDIEPLFQELDPDESPDPYSLVMSLNYHRRHLTPVQSGQALRAFLEAKGGKKQPGKRTDLSSDDATPPSLGQVAKELGIPRQTAQDHIKAAKDYEASAPELKEKVDQGEITAEQARKVTEKFQGNDKPIDKGLLDLKMKQQAKTDQRNRFLNWWKKLHIGLESWAEYYCSQKWSKAQGEAIQRNIRAVREHLKTMEVVMVIGVQVSCE